MCRYTFLSMIFFFAFAFAFLGIGANQAIQEASASPDAFSLTATSIIGTATANAQPSRTIDPFALTATSIIQTATANAPQIALTGTDCVVEVHYFTVDYSYQNGENWEHLPDIQERQETLPCHYKMPEYSHRVAVWTLDIPSNETMILVIEDLVSRLADYPPLEPSLTELVGIGMYTINYGPFPYGEFQYSEALNAYESGLSGLDLMETLGVPSVETIILRDLSFIQNVMAGEAANPNDTSLELTLTAIIGTATASTATPNEFDLTATSIIQTATAMARPSRTIDPLALTATSIIQTATAMADGTDSSSQVKPSITPEGFGPTATALVLTANAQSYPSLEPLSMTATAIVANATAQAQPTVSGGNFELTATSIILTATAMAQPTTIAATPDEFELTATSIVATATANAQPSEPFLPYPHTATAFAQTEAAIAIASPTYCQGFDWTFTYFAAEVSYGIDAHEITRHYCTETDFTLYSFEVSILDWEGTLSDEEFYMLFESSVASPVVFPEEYPIRKPDISELILVTNLNTMQSWEFTYTDAVDAWEAGLRGQAFAEALGVVLP